MQKTIIYATTIEEAVYEQVKKIENSPIGKNSHIRIMPDCHAGAGCVIGLHRVRARQGLL